MAAAARCGEHVRRRWVRRVRARRAVVAVLVLPSSLALSAIPLSMALARILCLHGSGGTSASFLQSLSPIASATPAFEFDAIDAPAGDGRWWTYPKGFRSFTAESYEGADESIEAVEKAIKEGGYTGVLG